MNSRFVDVFIWRLEIVKDYLHTLLSFLQNTKRGNEPFVRFRTLYNLKIHEERPKYAMKLVGRWTFVSFFSRLMWVDEIASFGREKVLLRGMSSFCKKPFFCQTMDLNFSLACQSSITSSKFEFSSCLAFPAQTHTDTNISRVLAFPFSDSLVLFLPVEQRAEAEEREDLWRLCSVVSRVSHL